MGNLAGAKVEIYKLEDNGTFTLKWEENTTNGADLADIGNFNTHAMELEDESFYLYKVTGGDDWDADDDGNKDANCHYKQRYNQSSSLKGSEWSKEGWIDGILKVY